MKNSTFSAISNRGLHSSWPKFIKQFLLQTKHRVLELSVALTILVGNTAISLRGRHLIVRPRSHGVCRNAPTLSTVFWVLFAGLSSDWGTTTGELQGPNDVKCLCQGYNDPFFSNILKSIIFQVLGSKQGSRGL